MTFTPKAWQNAPSTATPIDQAALQDMETRLSAYSATLPGPTGPTGPTGVAGGTGPAGPTGPRGEMLWRGAYNAGTSYAVGDAVSEGESSYIAIKAGTGHTPSALGGWWELVAKKGATGATGPEGPAGSGGGGSGVEGGVGVLAASYGRTSTISAPTLRDVVSILDFAGSTNGNGTTDDGPILREAFAAIAAKGGGTLIITPLNKKGEQATWFWGLNFTGGLRKVGVEIPDDITVFAYGAHFKCKSITSIEEGEGRYGKAMIGNELNGGSSGVYQAKRFHWYGGIFDGQGTEKTYQYVFQMYRVKDVLIQDTYVENWGNTAAAAHAGGVSLLSDCRRTRLMNNTAVKCAVFGGQNVWDWFVTELGTNATPNTEHIITGNIATACGAAPICVQVGKESQYVNTAPTNCLISNNVLESVDWVPIIVEMGGNPTAPKTTLEGIRITNNICTLSKPGTFTGSFHGIQVVNDSTPRVSNAEALSDIVIEGNTVYSTWNGITVQGSRVEVNSNHITAVNTGVFCAPVGETATNATNVHVKGGSIRLKGNGKGYGVWLSKVIGGSVEGVEVHFDETVEREDSGLYLASCERIDVTAFKAELPQRRGILIEKGGNIYINSGTRIYRPSDEAAGYSAIEIVKITGNVYIAGTNIRDTESKMEYGIKNTSPEGGLVFVRECTILGYTKAPFTGTITVKADNVVDLTGGLERGGSRYFYGTAIPAAAGVTYNRGDRCVNTAPASKTGVGEWVCYEAGLEGAAKWAELKLV